MKQNIKLFFASLISNNSAIDGARKKPWYAAIIIFFVSIILSVIPGSVSQLKQKGESYFTNTTYLFREASYEFSKDINKPEYSDKMYVIKGEKDSTLAGDSSINFEYLFEQVTYNFTYAVSEDDFTFKKASFIEAGHSFVIFGSNYAYIRLVNPNDHTKAVVELSCRNAYKKISANEFKEALDTNEDKTTAINNTWDHWKTLTGKLYNQTRLTVTGSNLLIMSAINVGIALIMGFMVWVLCRGKNNPYRLFNVWECFKIAFWASLSPAILTVGLGFLIKNFAMTLFPLLLGVRTMWLTMKSLRPDGSGYAAN